MNINSPQKCECAKVPFVCFFQAGTHSGASAWGEGWRKRMPWITVANKAHFNRKHDHRDFRPFNFSLSLFLFSESAKCLLTGRRNAISVWNTRFVSRILVTKKIQTMFSHPYQLVTLVTVYMYNNCKKNWKFPNQASPRVCANLQQTDRNEQESVGSRGRAPQPQSGVDFCSPQLQSSLLGTFNHCCGEKQKRFGNDFRAWDKAATIWHQISWTNMLGHERHKFSHSFWIVTKCSSNRSREALFG